MTSPLWCADDMPHPAHSERNEFGDWNYCTGRPPALEYVYTVRSNKPLALGVGIGNMPHVYHDENGWHALAARGRVQRAESNGAAAGVGLRMSLELMEPTDS